MKAVRLLEYGGQLVFDDVPAPAIARDEILVKIRSTAVNHLDLVAASGTVRQILPIDLPWIPGHEFAGVVEQIGSDVSAWAPGDAVFGATSGMGAYAEYVAVKAAAIARKPSNLSFEEAASVPVASQTAWEGIFAHGHLEKGQTILIHGGAGAVGSYAVQLASQAGATVIATASGDDEAYLNTQKRSFLVLKEGGHLVSATQPVSQEEKAMHRVSGMMMRLAPSGEKLGRIGRGSDTTRRRDRVRARRCGPGLEGHCRKPAEGSWDVARWAGSGKTQVTRQDRASCGLDISNG
jgi:D-arabinose 1-dehydrogenase-like Zn-dependent alcohol dehydrogenase